MQIRTSIAWLLLGCVSCSTPPASPYAAASAAGYHAREELHERVLDLQQVTPGVWSVGLGASARSFVIVSTLSSDAELVVARAKSALATGESLYATVLSHESAPRAKTPEAISANAETPYSWIIVRLGSEPDPQIAR